MPNPSREGGSMRNKDRSEDERRLFPSKEKPDPHAVVITPGESFQPKKKNIPSGFKPYDTISNGARDSGPVRASGKEKRTTYFNSQNHSALSPPRLNHADTLERSSKRRRIESPEETMKVISISDDEGPDRSMTRVSPVATRSTALSPTPSQLSNPLKNPRHHNGGHPSPFRAVDRGTRVPRPSNKKSTSRSNGFSSDDQDRRFTMDAAEQRRRESLSPSVEPGHVSRKPPEQASNLSVEILNNPTAFNNTAKNPPQNTLSRRNARAFFSRESPDELQGEVTVRPVPSSLNKPKGDPASISTSSDIRPTEFSRQKPGNRKTKKGKSIKERQLPSFRVFYFRGGAIIRPTLGGENDKVIVKSVDREITISVADAGYVRTIPLQKILKVMVGDDSSRKLRLELSKVSGEDSQLDIELASPEEKASLCSILEELGIDSQEKSGDWMNKAFTKSQRYQKQLEESYKRPLPLVEVMEKNPPPMAASSKRVKLSDGLRDNTGNITMQESASADGASGNRAGPLLAATKPSEACNTGRASTLSHPQPTVGGEIPVKKSEQALIRATRSMSRRIPNTLICDDDDDHGEDPAPQSTRDMDQKWNTKPLVYPRYGKKKAEVNALDLERLAPREFLNDNIIGFYIRFLEDHLQRCNAEAAKRVYFFNSYFFATLTNSPKGRRNINYEGVEKWTRNIDLFSYDYIIVPINEDAHWYLAIICNLPHLQGITLPLQPLSEDREVPETPEPSQREEQEYTKEEIARHSLASISLTEKEGSQTEGTKSGDEWPEREHFADPSRLKPTRASSQTQPASQQDSEATASPKKPRKGKKKQTFGVKYDVYQPIVITFDSLNASRSTTIGTLREYLYAEAKSKKDIEINKALIKGMTAKEIPLQPNYSDCGLYLLAYVEKFVQDPDVFGRRLLRRDMRTKEDWPPLRSGLLRTRLRKFMEQLYSEQEHLTKEKANKSTLMVDQQPISYLLGSSDTETEEKVEEKAGERQKSPQVETARSPPHEPQSKLKVSTPHRDTSTQTSKNPSPKVTKQAAPPENAGVHESTANFDPDESADSPTEHPPSSVQGSTSREVIQVPDSQEQANTSTEATEAMPQEQAETHQASFTSLVKPTKKGAETLYVDDTDGDNDGVECVSVSPSRKRTGKNGRGDGRVEVQIKVSGTQSESPNAKR
ncbi:hypothetical protein BJX99DRAFT_106082 [Aspergillus californicus]